tara:strand:- start:1029 stop:1226 length:198 start_codon:yes stop_codon:yes gene_type:complete
MIYLKDLNNNIKEFKDSDTKTVEALLNSNRWTRCSGRKDLSDYVEVKKAAKKPTKKKKQVKKEEE